jgi:hypothetical protein
MRLRIADCGLRNEGARLSRAASSALTSPLEGEVKTRSWTALIVIAALLASPAPLHAQPPDIRATVEGAPKKLALSESMRVTLVLEGPKPLRVDLPKQLLTADANVAWRIRPEGAAKITSAGEGREQWRQVYRLDPYAEGAPLAASFSAVTVNGQSVTWPRIEVEVRKSVGELATTPPRAPVGVEEPVPCPLPPPGSSLLQWIALGAVLLVVLGVVTAWALSRHPKPVPPHEQAGAALAKLLAADSFGAAEVERLATILRRFVEGRFAIPAIKFTTTELLSAAREQGWPVEQADALRLVLDECDRAKFAGDVPDHDGCRRLVALAVDWINDVSRPVGPG